MDPSLSVAVALGAFFIWALVIYNRLVALRNGVASTLARIDVQLKRRHDLIPSLMEAARGSMAHERETLQLVTAARDAAQAARGAGPDPADAPAMAKMAQAEGALSSTLNRFLALVESYPELKADRNMMQFSQEIAVTENQLSHVRQAYNDAVMQFNTALQAFPAVMFAGMLGFKPAAMLAPLEYEAEREPPVAGFQAGPDT